MKIFRAKRAGFCMGVSLALEKLDKVLQQNLQSGEPARICTIGPIIHNPQVLKKYEKMGVVCLADCGEIRENDQILIRAHGITKEEEKKARSKARIVVDATCPRVKNAQLAIQKAASGNKKLLLFGEPDHPEVRGLLSYAGSDAVVFQSLSMLAKETLDKEQIYILASQTTQDKVAFKDLAAELGSQLPHLVILDTICDATRLRQRETMELAAMVDCMIVVGGKSSGNTRRLASIAAESGISVFHIETEAELDKNELSRFEKIGITAGASTPVKLIENIEIWLNSL